MNGDDVGVIQFGQGLGFAGEPVGKHGVVADFRGKNLDGDHAVQGCLSGFVDSSHAAAAK